MIEFKNSSFEVLTETQKQYIQMCLYITANTLLMEVL